MDAEKLSVEEATDLTQEDYKKLCEYKDSALKVAEDTNDKLRTQLNQQVEMYNRDMDYMNSINQNTVKYTRAKEDALHKILEGVSELIKLDRMPIAPKTEEE